MTMLKLPYSSLRLLLIVFTEQYWSGGASPLRNAAVYQSGGKMPPPQRKHSISLSDRVVLFGGYSVDHAVAFNFGKCRFDETIAVIQLLATAL